MANSVLSKLHRPYYVEKRASRQWLVAAVFGGFVSLFLYVFRPFGLGNAGQDIGSLALGYGLTTFAVMTLLNVIMIPFFPGFFNDERWTVARELVWSLVNVALIGVANALYSACMGMVPFTAGAVLVFEAYTISIGIFPVAINVLLREWRLTKTYRERSQRINERLETAPAEQQTTTTQSTKVIRLTSDNGKEEIPVPVDDLFFIRSADNYVEVHFRQNGEIRRKVLRNTLKRTSEQLPAGQQLFKCHKSYLVNLQNVVRVSGNAQGYKLHFPGLETPVPVSRQLNEEIRNRLGR